MTDTCVAWIGFAGSLVGALLAGGIALIVMYITTKQTRKIQDENKHDAVHPLLVFTNDSLPIHKFADSSTKGVHIYEIENIGNGCAKDIEISVDCGGELEKLTFVVSLKRDKQTGVLTITSDKLYDCKFYEKIVLHIDYHNIYGKKYSTNYTLSCKEFAFQTEKVVFK